MVVLETWVVVIVGNLVRKSEKSIYHQGAASGIAFNENAIAFS
jgi:hypothetical protein